MSIVQRIMEKADCEYYAHPNGIMVLSNDTAECPEPMDPIYDIPTFIRLRQSLNLPVNIGVPLETECNFPDAPPTRCYVI